MTHLPLEDRNVWGVPGPKYEPVGVCAHPFCDCVDRLLERHHLWPRSFLRNQPTDWVKLPDERIVQNCIYLCREHHQRITENLSKILWNSIAFVWLDGYDTMPVGELNPQPRFRDLEVSSLPMSAERGDALSGKDSLSATDSDSNDGRTANTSHVHEGQECPTCHRRVPKKRKATTPTSKVHSFRGPLDEADITEETWIAAAKHMGVYEKGFWKHHVVMLGLASLLQGPGASE